MIMTSSTRLLLFALALFLFASETGAFSPEAPARICRSSPSRYHSKKRASSTLFMASDDKNSDNDDTTNKPDGSDVLNAAIAAMYGGEPLTTEKPAETQARIQGLVESNPILLFMKGSKSFPQCGFSDTATKILEQYQCEFETVDVLSDEAMRQGIKEYSQCPTIPQLYVNGEFIGGSDIMLQMYESGELKELIGETTSK